MKQENRSLRIGTAVVVGAVLLRLFGGNLPDRVISFFSKPQVVSTMLFLETGRVVRLPEAEVPVQLSEPTEQAQTEPLTADKPVFSASDAQLVQINDTAKCDPDVEALLERKLDWQLSGEAPTVLILHTHGSESYKGSCDGDSYRTQQTEQNMLAVGSRLTTLLQEAGIGVIQDRAIHDYPSYNGSYSQARESIRTYLEQYPSIRLVLDLHRDAVADSDGSQRAVSVAMGDQTAAQLMLVVGTNAGGLTHPDWQENLALGVKLHAQLEKLHPGITRPISLRSQRFNQDLTPGALLVEVGAAGNTLTEAMKAVEVLAEAIIDLANGTGEAGS